MSDMEHVKVSEKPQDAQPEGGASGAAEEGVSEGKQLNLAKNEAPAPSEGGEVVAAPKIALGKQQAQVIPASDDDASGDDASDDDASGDDASGDDDDEAVGDGAPPRFTKKPFIPWPVEPDHSSAKQMLMQGEEVDLNEVLEDQKLEAGSNGMNFVLLLLVLITSGAGIFQLRNVSNPDILEAKRAAAAEEEQAHIEEQLKLKKTYGTLNIDSIPQQAVIYKREKTSDQGAQPDFKPIESKKKTGETVRALTPLILKDMDVAKIYEFRLEAEGYLPYTFHVAKHIWTNEGGDLKFIKQVDMTAMACEYWFLYDSEKKEEQKFDDKPKCNVYFDEAKAKSVTVTDCTCKELPEGVEPGEKKDEKKK
ncbi:hypothetical protein KKF91_09625 [Myxococcota bacterium]|nr:hypothetical protein [Myxococcota bacterium]MBU1430801.1 hypothetical protein [Myxococcota bacterium]MBU1900115.1 hypothetical protein [Myxococcota bacterium]